MMLYSYEQIHKTVVDSSISASDMREVLDAIKELKPAVVIRECDGCMGAAFGDCADCERIVFND